MKYRVCHKTSYVYSEMVVLCHNEVRLIPRYLPQQLCRSSKIVVYPEPAARADHVDFFGNHVTFFTVQDRHLELQVAANIDVEVNPPPGVDPVRTPAWEEVRDIFPSSEMHRHFDAIQFVRESFYVKKSSELADYALVSFTPHRPILDAALDLTHRIHADFKYDTGATNIHTSATEVFNLRRGVCQDFAHLELSCLRSLGLPARYISGYLSTSPLAGSERMIGSDASHAWIALYCPGFGWTELDPTNNLIPTDKHVLLAWGRDYADVSPIKGVILGGGKHSIRVSVDVQAV